MMVMLKLKPVEIGRDLVHLPEVARLATDLCRGAGGAV